MADAAAELAELLSAPLEELIVSLGSGIGRAQAELDRHSIEIQEQIDEHPTLSQYGLEATWYQIPSTQLELRLAIAMQRTAGAVEEPPAPTRSLIGPAAELPPLARQLPRLWVSPVNPRYQNQFSYNVNAASTVTLTIVPVPPPGRAAAATPNMTSDQALAAATPYLFTQNDVPTDRVTVNFNPGARAWYVVQTRETETGTELRSLVKIDDE